MGEIIQFIPKPNHNRPSSMADYYRECALTGGPIDPNKAKLGDPGVIQTIDGDLLMVGSLHTPDKPA